MILWFYSLSELNFEELMSVYEEGNRENGAYFYPQESSAAQILLAEHDFADYLRQTFFRQKGAAYCVLTRDGSYISAARIEPFEDGYLLSALETRPGLRRRGYGRQLMNELIDACVNRGYIPIYSHVSNRNIPSLDLHLQCGFQVHKEFARYLDGSVRADSKTLIYEK